MADTENKTMEPEVKDGKNSKNTKNKDSKATPKKSFFKGLKKEFKKVTWPDRKETVKQTTAVIVISIILGAIIAFMDTIIQYGVNFLTTF